MHLNPIYIYIYIALAALLLLTNSNFAHADTQNVDVKVTLTPTLEVQMPSSVSLIVSPTPEGKFVSEPMDIKVGTNNVGGYNLSMEVSDNTLINSVYPTDENAKLRSITTTTTESNFPLNQWGYSEDGGASYLKVASKNMMTNVDHAINTSTTSLRFAAKVDLTRASGEYNGAIKFIVLANLPPCDGEWLGGVCVTYLQDFASSKIADIKTAMIEEQQYQFRDIRDNKPYYVAKLKDGNVWMTQNLDLDLSTSKALTPEDSDVSTDYTPAVSTTTGNVYNDGNQYTGENSWDGGNYYWKGPDTWLDWTNNPAGYGSSTFSSAFSTNIADAGTAGAHYHVGNLYQWSAATARTGNGLANGTEATSSICPKGWRLPYSGDDTTDKTFGKMLSPYGAASSNANHVINKSPLFFVPAGVVNSGSLYYGAYGGYYWSSRAYNEDATNYAYFLSFYTSGVNPSSNDSRYYGFSVRCVVRASAS